MKNMDLLLISSSDSMRLAIELIDKNKQRFLICVENAEKVIGTVTDGDIRRALLNDISLESNLEKVYNKSFIYLESDASFDEVCEKFKNSKIDFLPILDNNKNLVNVLTKKQFHIMLLENIKFDLSINFTQFDNQTLEHEIYNRPWGFYKSTVLSTHAQAKIITVFPHSELSLQEHKKREEHWVVIKGYGKVVLGESVINAYPGKYIYIPKGCRHQIINDSNENILFSEVQLGDYFGEDDIIRYSDKYGRANK